MCSNTKQRIADAVEELISTQPGSRVTVQQVMELTQMNRQSFYYHYQDLPALLEEIIREEAEGIICKYPNVNSIVECYDALIEFASHRKRAIMHIYRSVNREMFEQYLMQVSAYFIRSYVDAALERVEISAEDRQTVIDYYKCVGFGLVLDWLNSGMNEDRAKAMRRMFLLKRDLSEEVAQLLSSQV